MEYGLYDIWINIYTLLITKYELSKKKNWFKYKKKQFYKLHYWLRVRDIIML